MNGTRGRRMTFRERWVHWQAAVATLVFVFIVLGACYLVGFIVMGDRMSIWDLIFWVVVGSGVVMLAGALSWRMQQRRHQQQAKQEATPIVPPEA
jgi:predicted membrane channel-forming protein YqfA (hemolysin III family)